MGLMPWLLRAIQLISRLALVRRAQGVTPVGSASRVRCHSSTLESSITGVLPAWYVVHKSLQIPTTLALLLPSSH